MATYTPYTLIPHPTVEGKYTLVAGDGETLGGTYNADGTAFKGQRAPWDDSGNVAPYDDGSKDPDIDPFDVNPSTGSSDEDDYWSFLGDDDGFGYVTPPLSQLESFKEWQSSVSRDRWSDEYSLQRYPGQTFLGMGPLATPEWFPTSYKAYKYAMPSQNASAGNITLPIDSIQESYGEDMANLLATLNSIGGGGWDAAVGDIDWDALNESIASGGDAFDINTVLEDTSYLVDLETYSLSGESLAEQSWFTPEKKEILNKYFEGMQSVFAGDESTFRKADTWASAKKSLALGVDPDKVFAELNTLADTPHVEWEDMPYNKGNDVYAAAVEGPQVVFDTINAEFGLEKYQEFNLDLEKARQKDPDSFSEMYNFLPLQDKLSYLHGLQNSGAITKEQYEGLFVQEVNANYDPVENPEAMKYVDINDKLYLDTSGSSEVDIERDLRTPQFYPRSDNPLDVNQFYQRIGNSVAGGRTDDFDQDMSLFPDWLDPIIAVVSMFYPQVGAAYTAIKGATGETLHAADWLRVVPVAIDYVNTEFGTAATYDSAGNLIQAANPVIPTTVAEVFGGKFSMGSVPQWMQDINLVYGANAAAAAAEGISIDDEFLSIGDIIKIGSVAVGQGGTNAAGVQQGCILSLSTKMSEAGIVIPEGAFASNDDGTFAGLDGSTIEFADTLDQLLTIYREEDPEAFAVDITDPDVDPSIMEVIGGAVYDGAKFLIEMQVAKAGESIFEGTAYGDFLIEADQFAVAAILATGGNILNQMNGVFTMGETHPENTKLAEVSRYLLGMSDEASPQSLKDSATKLQEFQAKFEDKEYLGQKTKEETINSVRYKALKSQLDMAVLSGSLTAERRDELLANTVETRNDSANTYNSVLNGVSEFFGGLKEAPFATSFEAVTELGEEAFSFFVASKIGLAAKGVLKTSSALGRRVDVADITADTLAQIEKAGGWATVGGSLALDAAEAIGGSASEAYNGAMAAQEKVETLAIRDSAEYKAFIKANGLLVQSGAMTEEQYKQAAKDYTLEKLNANDGDLRRSTVAANIAEKVGLAGGAAALASTMIFGNKFDQKVLKGLFGKKADAVKELGESFAERARKWAAKTGKPIKEWFKCYKQEKLEGKPQRAEEYLYTKTFY